MKATEIAETSLERPAARILSPATFRGLTLKSRLVVSPMCTYSANQGLLDDFHLVHLGRFAMGGAGLVFVEATAVNKSARITHGCAGLWSDAQIAPMKRVADFLHRFGSAAESSFLMLVPRPHRNGLGKEEDLWARRTLNPAARV